MNLVTFLRLELTNYRRQTKGSFVGVKAGQGRVSGASEPAKITRLPIVATSRYARFRTTGPAATPPLTPPTARFRQRLERNRKPSGRTPDPHRCNTDGLRPPTNRVATSPVRLGLAGGRGALSRSSGDDRNPLARGFGAPDLLRASVSVFRAFHALTGI